MRHSYLVGLRWMIGVALILAAGYATAFPGIAADAPAALTINVYTCDATHDPIDPNQTLLNECALGTADIPFTLEPVTPQSGAMMASTGSGAAPATIAFGQLAAGSYRLSQATPDAVAQSYVAACASTVREFAYPFTPFATIEPGGRLNIELLPGEQLTCDWYNILAAEPLAQTTLTVTVYSCDGDIIDPELCERAPDVELRLSDASAEIIITANANGIATFDGTGDYQIEAVSELDDRVTCGILSGTSNVDGPITLDPASPLALDAFYCYPGA